LLLLDYAKKSQKKPKKQYILSSYMKVPKWDTKNYTMFFTLCKINLKSHPKRPVLFLRVL